MAYDNLNTCVVIEVFLTEDAGSWSGRSDGECSYFKYNSERGYMVRFRDGHMRYFQSVHVVKGVYTSYLVASDDIEVTEQFARNVAIRFHTHSVFVSLKS